jgi:hypothetical protein
MAVPQSPSYPSARVIAELAREAQLQQLQSIDALDTKAATLIGFGGVLLGLVFTSRVATDHWNGALTIGIVVLAVAIVGLLLLLLPRRYRYDPNIVALSKRFLDRPAEETLVVAIDSIEVGLAYNADILKWKSRLLTGFAALAVVGIVVLSVALLYAVS